MGTYINTFYKYKIRKEFRMAERTGFKMADTELTLLGDELKVGDKAPEFKAIKQDLSEFKLSDAGDKIKLIFAVPSLDTEVCELETIRFNKEADKLGDDVIIIGVSADLPFAQSRFCAAKDIEHLELVSDHKDFDFGDKFGTHIKELRLENRSVFILDKDNTVQHVEYVEQNTEMPDFDAALAKAKELLNK